LVFVACSGGSRVDFAFLIGGVLAKKAGPVVWFGFLIRPLDNVRKYFLRERVGPDPFSGPVLTASHGLLFNRALREQFQTLLPGAADRLGSGQWAENGGLCLGDFGF
jgi:hypothetical protein